MTAADTFDEPSDDIRADEAPGNLPGDRTVHETVPASPNGRSLWGLVRSWLWPTVEQRTVLIQARLESLNDQIERYPDTASNYVIRGELYLEAQFYDLATQDFSKALELSEKQYETNDWGVVVQALQARAVQGLEQARRKQR